MTNVFPTVTLTVEQQAAQQAASLYPRPTTSLVPTAPPVETEATVYTFEEASADVQEWVSLKAQLDELKKKERALREKINASNLFDPTKPKGTQRYSLGNGYAIKTTRTQRTVVNNDDNLVAQTIMRLKALGQAESVRAEQLFRMKAELAAKTYKELSDVEKSIVDPLLTIKAGSVTLELEVPKE